MGNFFNGLYNIVSEIRPYGYLFVAASLMINGALLIVPSQKCKDIAKSAIPYTAIGCGIILLAFEFAQDWAQKFGQVF